MGIYLLKEYLHWGNNNLKGRGYKKVCLWVLEENTNAIKFYERQGFKYDNTIKEIIIGKPLNVLRYVKVLI